MGLTLGPFSFERVMSAVEDVRRRLLRATAALDADRVPYAVAGGNAVANWVSRVDTTAIRFTQDVDILIRRSELDHFDRGISLLVRGSIECDNCICRCTKYDRARI